MNRPKTTDGTPVSTSTKYRTNFANQVAFPNSTRYRATPMPIGTAMAVARATIVRVPRIADFTPPAGGHSALFSEMHDRPVGSVVKKSQLIVEMPRLVT